MKKTILSVLLLVVLCSIGYALLPAGGGANQAKLTGHGVLLLTYDDRNWDRWVEVLPMFKKYGAHASFYVSGAVAMEKDLKALKKIRQAGHTLGPHTMSHADMVKAFAQMGGPAMYDKEVKPQMEMFKSIGAHPKSLSYPNCIHNKEVDDYLMTRGFTRFRCGHERHVAYDPNHRRAATVWATTDELFFPVSELPTHHAINGAGMGSAYNTDIDDVCAAIRRAADKNEVLCIYSHDISANPNPISTKTEWLEKVLQTAQSVNMAILGMDELD